ncbi:hypothetical protein PC9H_008668 [Pleurotus ostreatus]|uniref:Protein kinase domain-containing protein n=1 Tax=Pleurotus ostreatus TaxID=5322 RepID=A0A8H7DQH4_PLEOS|nr:uncharacterized protein PC9H_008668 [Pleurotus ostreatus]KAF7426300.1 hypothetical protein PC9H_008668 [Pleurotus ostreatus]
MDAIIRLKKWKKRLSFGSNSKVKSSTEERSVSAGHVESVLPRKPAPQPTRKHGIHLEIPPGPSNGSPFAAEGPTLGSTITPTETIDSQSAFDHSSFLTSVQAMYESTTTVQNDGLPSQDTAIKSWGQLVSTFTSAIRWRKTRRRVRDQARITLQDEGSHLEGHIFQNTITLLSGVVGDNFEIAQKLIEERSRIQTLDPLHNLVGALDTRVRLLKLANDLNAAPNSALIDALLHDDEEIYHVLGAILLQPEHRRAALGLRGPNAQNLLNLIQDMLDKGFLSNTKDTGRTLYDAVHKLYYRLSVASGILPPPLMVDGVTLLQNGAVNGGGYADIFLASYQGSQVALKRLRIFLKGNDRHNAYKMICREALLWKKAQHKYVLPFLGIDAQTFSPSVSLLSPWMQNGTIIVYMQRNGDFLLREIAEGMEYLHSENIIHGDLRGANILMDSDWHVRIADFGLAILAETTFSDEGSSVPGAVRWMAPELFMGTPQSTETKFGRTKATDVYSFACTCVELCTGRIPFHEFGYDITVTLQVMDGKRPPCSYPSSDGTSKGVSEDLLSIVTNCWAQEPSDRPPMSEVVKMLDAKDNVDTDSS